MEDIGETNGAGSSSAIPLNDLPAASVENDPAPHAVLTPVEKETLADAMENSKQYMEKYQDIIIEKHGANLVWIADQKDLTLFREIRAWKEAHPESTIVEANREFILTRLGTC